MNEQTRRLRAESKSLKVSIMIGKNGITDHLIENIKKELVKSRIVKIRMFKSYIEGKDRKEAARDLAGKCSARIVDAVGFTVVLGK